MFGRILVASLVTAAVTPTVDAIDLLMTEPSGFVPPRVMLQEASKSVEGDSHAISLKLVLFNPNDWPVSYSGYVTESSETHQILPVYMIQLKRGGQWERFSLGWCGTGRGRPHLAARRTATFDARLPDDGWDAVRVGVRLVREANTQPALVVWSREMKRSRFGDRPDDAADARKQVRIFSFSYRL